MSNVTHLPGPQAANWQTFTNGHALLLGEIHALCLAISQRSEAVTATYHYCGRVHEVSVNVYPREAETIRSEWHAEAYLPGAHASQPLVQCTATLARLSEIVGHLQTYLPGGAA